MPSKTLHQRNKSSPALSTLARQTSSLNLVPKRTAFADVSNTSKPTQPIRDDSAISTKPNAQPLKERRNVEAIDKAAALQKPAQRPISVSSIRGFLNSLGNNPPAFSRIATAEQRTLSAVPEANDRKPLSRKQTMVLRDVEPIPAEPTVEAKSSDDGADDVGKLRESEMPPEPGQSVAVSSFLPEPNSNLHQAQIDGGCKPEATYLPSLSNAHGPRLSVPIQHLEIAESMINTGPPQPGEEVTNQSSENSSKPHHSSLRADFPYYKDTEPGPDSCYEDDYSTKRSLKPRADHTTGSTTIILAPKVNARVERELEVAKQFVVESQETAELEEDEAWDTSMVSEYGEEIFSYMRKMEEQMRPNPHYMDSQTEVQWSMRSVLMDWLVQVHHRFSLLPETLFLCVNYIDRFLSCKIVSLNKLQLVGATAIFVAAKYEEINCPSVQEIVYMVDGGYSIDEILKAERFMLSMLHFELGWPGPMSFLRRVSKADDYDLETRTLAKYFLELTIMDERFVGCIPSYAAAGAHCLARLMLRKGNWVWTRHLHP